MEKPTDFVLRPRSRRPRVELTTCQDCQVQLTNDNWTPSNQKYRRYICGKCWTARQARYQAVDPSRRLAKLAKAKETRAGWSEERKAQEQRRRYSRWLQRQYGISIAEFDSMFAAQGGRCAICGTDDPGGRGCFHVDHCHDSGFVRALLCSRCNMMIGLAKDSREVLLSAATYIETHRKH